jgi:hypothetical protein
MEQHIYTKVRENWNYVHPVNKAMTTLDYFIEKIARKLKKTLYMRQLKFGLKNRLHV